MRSLAFPICLGLLFVGIQPLGASQSRQAPIEKSGSCPVVGFEADTRPGWATTGDWTSPDELLLIDALQKEFLRYNDQGAFLGRQLKPTEVGIKKHFKDFLPVVAHGSQERLWVQLVGTRMAKVEWGEVTATLDLWGLPLRDDAKLVGILGWTLSDNELFGYGTFEMKDESIRAGFFRLNLEAPSDTAIIQDFPRDSPVHIWYRLGHNYLASLDGAEYALWVDEDAVSLLRYTPDNDSLHELTVIPDELRSPPALPKFESARDFRDVMTAVQNATMPTGLHAWEGYVYLTWRSRHSSGRQNWFVSRIDPERGEIIETTALPSEANHLLVIPGSESWALVEKGPVEGFGFQTTERLRYIPASEIRGFTAQSRLCQ